ncbi:MAG: homoserine kinase [Candidatus Dormibacteraeota bacterium]|nr:homoserine kinase [Candidatus Dormibacteraeota bacterium]
MRVFIAAPASIANLGPGFDILALALQLQNDVRAQTRQDGTVTIDPGEGAPPSLRDSGRNLVTRSYELACDAIGVTDRGVDFTCVSRIPIARGLGSSAAATLSGVLAAVALHRAPWDEQAVIDCAAELEGHRDNVAAALLGGLAVCAPGIEAVRMDVDDDLRAVMFIPAQRLSTHEARTVVPTQFSREDAIFNAARCALLVRAFAQRDYATLAEAMDDRWHQPQRAALMPAIPRLIAAARAAGALGAALAGAGPSIVALSVRDHDSVTAALRREAESLQLSGDVMVVAPRNYGARVDLKP